MYRRRRPKREIAFSFDSFLDVVANVCGIIIRLILVAWVGARAYHAGEVEKMLNPGASGAVSPRSVGMETDSVSASKRVPFQPPPLTDPLEEELRQHREELARQQQRLLEQLRQCQLLETTNAETAQNIETLTATEHAAEQERGKLATAAAQSTSTAKEAQLSLADLQKRGQQLAAQLRELESLPPLKKTLRYRTPVSRPVHSEELHFECKEGRVCFIDIQAFLIEIRRGLEDKAESLKSRWEVEGTAGPVGAYRLHYTVERERGLLDSAGGLPASGGFRYGLGGWAVEPILPVRGETAAAALAPTGEFRRLADAIDPEQTVVTMWVYPDSFALYRQLRDFLYERGIEVAGRPLPVGMSIASSRHGSASRGQ
jgi:hypothetical protein